ncbi:hypothetical protein HID58_028253, partial [Brassica napus]
MVEQDELGFYISQTCPFQPKKFKSKMGGTGWPDNIGRVHDQYNPMWKCLFETLLTPTTSLILPRRV